MKTYVITLSKNYLSTHPRIGEPTYFRDQFLNGEKIHTIRGNFPLWEKRIAEVHRGEAYLSIREWEGKPYRSKQIEITRLTNRDGVGIQLCYIRTFTVGGVLIPAKDKAINSAVVAQNDGLDLEDFKAWFKKYDLTQPYAIIHFTQFRY